MSLLCNEAPPGYLRPLVETDETHQRASIIIATAVLLFAALLFVGSRLWVRLNPDRDNTGGVGVAATDGTILGLEDLLVVIATVSTTPTDQCTIQTLWSCGAGNIKEPTA